MIRPQGFSQSQVMARQFAKCRLCPRGFEGAVVLLWEETPCCQSCFIRKLEEKNAKLNEIQSQQTKAVMAVEGRQALNVADMTYPEASSLSEHKTADTSQETDEDHKVASSRPGIHGPQETDVFACTLGGGISSEMSRTVDTQSQDCHNRKAGEVTFYPQKSPGTNFGGKE